MKPVIQEEITGCGIASSAAIAGVSYKVARQNASDIGICAQDPSLWSGTQHVRDLLASFNIDTDENKTPFQNWESLPDCALLAIKWHREKGKPFWHWTVFVRQGSEQYVLDSNKSLKNNIRKDLGRIKPKWYIKVHV